MIKKNLLLFLSLFFIVNILPAADVQYTVIRNDANVFHIKIHIPKPVLRLEQGKTFAFYPDAQYYTDAQNAYLPVLSKLFNLSSKEAPQVKIIQSKISSMQTPNYLIAERSSIKLENDNSGQVAQAKYLGNYSKIPLFVLNIFPVRYNVEQGRLDWYEEIELEVTAGHSNQNTSVLNVQTKTQNNSFLNRVILNQKQTFSVSEEPVSVLDKTAETAAGMFDRYTTLFKILVDEEGIYKITYADLEDAEFPIASVNPSNLRLFNKGREVPLYLHGLADGTFDEKDYIEFWGQRNEKTLLERFPDIYADPFSDINVYWLAAGNEPGMKMSEESGRLLGGEKYVFQPYAYTETLHFEEDNHHENFGHSTSKRNRPSYELDHWYFDSGISAPEGIAYDFYVPYPFESGSNVEITAAFRGKSYFSSATNPLVGHQVDLKLRGKGDVSKLIARVVPADHWRDQEMRFISNADSAVKISQSVLNNGLNRIEVDMFQTGVTDIVLMNWFEIKYLRKYRAYKNYIKFHVDEDFFNNAYVNIGDNIQINVDGFDTSDISLYKIGVSKLVNGKIAFINDNNFHSFGISFQDQIFDPSIEYVALTESAKKKPLSIIPFKPWNGRNANETLLHVSVPINYLIVTHELFYQNAIKLRDLKIQQGLSAEVVTVENIYDTFNNGIKSPLAIKEFIKYAVQNWSVSAPLEYVVFVGKASYDYKGRIKKDSDLVPTFLYQTEKYGAAASDYWYSLLDDDYIPDVCVARIPASTNQELLNYIDKVAHYEQENNIPGEWINNALFISGNDAGNGDREYLTNQPIFRSQNLRLLNNQLPQNMFTSRLNTVKDESIQGYDPDFGSTTDLKEYFNDGLAFVNFLGHGGGGIWADVNLLNLSDVDDLNNGYKLPFVASMTCFTGAFENPSRLGLAEKLILSEKKGAIGILAASGVGWKYNDFAVEWSLLDFLWDKNLTFGQAVNLMKIHYMANPVYTTEEGDFYTFGYGGLKHSMVNQYNFLGDPSLRIIQPQEQITVQVSNPSPSAGDTLDIRLSGTSLNAADGHVKITNQQNLLVYEHYFSYTSGYSFRFPVPEAGAGQTYTVKAFVSVSSANGAGNAFIQVERPFIKSVSILPRNPKVNQPISFSIVAKSQNRLTEMELINFRNFNTPYGSSTRIQMERVNDTLFQSSNSYGGFSDGGVKYFDIYAKDETGKTFLQRRQAFTVIDTRPDIALKVGSLAYTGSDKLQLKFEVQNNSDSSLSNVKIRCFDQQSIETGDYFTELSVPVNAREQKIILVDYTPANTATVRSFKIISDPDDTIDESNENNNVLLQTLTTDHVFINHSLGTSSDGMSNDTIRVAAKWNYFVEANTLPSSAVIQFSEIDLSGFLKADIQKGLRYVPFHGSQDSSGITITYPPFISEANLKATLSVKLDTTVFSTQEVQNITLFRFDSYLNLWLLMGKDSLRNGILYATINKSGDYAVFYANDKEKPVIEVSADGRPIVKNMTLSGKPRLSMLLQDENGVNFTNSLNVFLDDIPYVINGVPQIQQEVSIPDSLRNSKAVMIALSPNLEAGTHTLNVSVTDVNGNLAEQNSQFVITDNFTLTIHGNYPNPFSDETILAYTVSSINDLDDFKIRIYTVSGRLIRKTMLPFDESINAFDDDIRSVGYHEVVWDGRDDDGKQVANGVYFMVVTGKFRGKTVKRTLKIARLR